VLQENCTLLQKYIFINNVTKTLFLTSISKTHLKTFNTLINSVVKRFS